MDPVTALLYRMNHTPLWHRSVRVWGSSIRSTSLDRLVALSLHRLGLMGAAERRVLEQRVRPGMCIVDIGANVGIYSLLLARLAGAGGRVFAFEPEPNLFQTLQANCERNSMTNLMPLNFALGDSAGSTEFYRSPFNTGDNRLGGLGWMGLRLEVEMIRLDDALPAIAVDFVKMDVQGYEMAVFRGMEGVFRDNPQLEVFFEFWPWGLRAAGTDPDELLEHLFQRGFHVFATDGDDLRPVVGSASLATQLKGRRYTNLLASPDAM